MGWEAGEETSMHRTLDPRSRDLGLFVLFAPSIDKDQRLPESVGIESPISLRTNRTDHLRGQAN
jgi:hypothetical protein